MGDSSRKSVYMRPMTMAEMMPSLGGLFNDKYQFSTQKTKKPKAEPATTNKETQPFVVMTAAQLRDQLAKAFKSTPGRGRASSARRWDSSTRCDNKTVSRVSRAPAHITARKTLNFQPAPSRVPPQRNVSRASMRPPALTPRQIKQENKIHGILKNGKNTVRISGVCNIQETPSVVRFEVSKKFMKENKENIKSVTITTGNQNKLTESAMDESFTHLIGNRKSLTHSTGINMLPSKSASHTHIHSPSKLTATSTTSHTLEKQDTPVDNIVTKPDDSDEKVDEKKEKYEDMQEKYNKMEEELNKLQEKLKMQENFNKVEEKRDVMKMSPKTEEVDRLFRDIQNKTTNDTTTSPTFSQANSEQSFLEQERVINRETEREPTQDTPIVSTPFRKYRNVEEYFNESSDADNTLLANVTAAETHSLRADKSKDERDIAALCRLMDEAKFEKPDRRDSPTAELLAMKTQLENERKRITESLERNRALLDAVDRLLGLTAASAAPVDIAVTIETASPAPRRASCRPLPWTSETNALRRLPHTDLKRVPRRASKSPAYTIPKRSPRLARRALCKSAPVGLDAPGRSVAIDMYMRMKQQCGFLMTPVQSGGGRGAHTTPARTSRNLQVQLERLYAPTP